MDLKQIENLPALTGDVRTQYVERDGSRYLVAIYWIPINPRKAPCSPCMNPFCSTLPRMPWDYAASKPAATFKNGIWKPYASR